MRVLISYDGGEYSDNIARDLARAGLPPIVEACVLTVANVPSLMHPTSTIDAIKGRGGVTPTSMSSRGVDHVTEAHRIADREAAHLRYLFPEWNVDMMVCVDAPASSILERAEEWKPDLIVVGTHGRSWLGRFIRGSIAHRIVTDAAVSVRVARAHPVARGSAIHLLAAIDATEDSTAAINEIADRQWPQGTTVSVVTVMELFYDIWDPQSTLLPEWADNEIEEETRRLASCATECVTLLRSVGLEADAVMLYGDPKQEISEEAQRRGTDSIFLGAKRHHLFERFIRGSVSASVVKHAECSVEIVRPPVRSSALQ